MTSLLPILTKLADAISARQLSIDEAESRYREMVEDAEEWYEAALTNLGMSRQTVEALETEAAKMSAFETPMVAPIIDDECPYCGEEECDNSCTAAIVAGADEAAGPMGETVRDSEGDFSGVVVNINAVGRDTISDMPPADAPVLDAEVLRQRFRATGRMQSDLARDAKIGAGEISKWRNGKTRLGVTALTRIQATLDAWDAAPAPPVPAAPRVAVTAPKPKPEPAPELPTIVPSGLLSDALIQTVEEGKRNSAGMFVLCRVVVDGNELSDCWRYRPSFLSDGYDGLDIPYMRFAKSSHGHWSPFLCDVPWSHKKDAGKIFAFFSARVK